MIVLDTHAWLWSIREPERLSRPAASALRRERAKDARPVLAAITLVETAELVRAEKFQVEGPFKQWLASALQTSGVTVADVTVDVAEKVLYVSECVRNPADRLIVATAMSLGAWLVTNDALIREADCVKTIW